MGRKTKVKMNQLVRIALLCGMEVDGISIDESSGVNAIGFYDFLTNNHLSIYDNDFLNEELKSKFVLKELACIALAHDYISDSMCEDIKAKRVYDAKEYNALAESLYVALTPLPIMRPSYVKYSPIVKFYATCKNENDTTTFACDLHSVKRHLECNDNLNAFEHCKMTKAVETKCALLDKQMEIVNKDCFREQKHMVEGMIR